MSADPQWFANEIAVISAAVSGIALVTATVSVLYTRRQAKASVEQAQAAERQARTAEETLRIQSEALRVQPEDATRALTLAERNANEAEASVAAAKSLAEAIERNAEFARFLDSTKC